VLKSVALKQSILRRVAIVGSIALLAACATVEDSTPDEEIMQVKDNVYELLDVDRRGIFGSESSLIAAVVNQANDFAASKGKVASPLAARIHRVGILGDWGWFYYKFALVNKGTPESQRNMTDITIERDARLARDFFVNRHKVETVSPYEELLKLDELRKRGVITEAEFNAQKAKLLGAK